MSRLINPGLGDQVDRLTILSLKILYGELAGKDTTHFANERAALIVQVNARSGSASWYELGLQLHATNAALWQAEDELRGYRGDGGPIKEAALCAFRIQDLNDRRAQLIQQINTRVGDNLGEEKLT